MQSRRTLLVSLLLLVVAKGNSQTYDFRSYVQQLVDAVSRDSLMSYIVTLQNFGTRYEYTPQRDSAASYIAREFNRWGLETSSDDYLFSRESFTGMDLIGDRGVCLVGDSLILRSTDDGLIWTRCVSQSYGYFTGVDFVDSLHGWIVSQGGVIVATSDGGSTWVTQVDLSIVFPGFVSVSFGDTLRGIAAGSKRSYHTTNGGLLWLPCDIGNNRPYDVQMIDASHAWTAGSSITYTSDGGSTWAQQFTADASQLCAVHMATPTLGWAVGWSWSHGFRALMLKTTDGGTNWVQGATPQGLMRLYDVQFRDSLQGWIVDMTGSILRSDDGGKSWHDLQTGWTPSASKIALRGIADAYVCGAAPYISNGLIQKTTDAGQTWMTLTDHLPPGIIHRSRNIVGTITGKRNPERECVIVGHYDSGDGSPGADDNASGTSAVMEAARVCSQYVFANTIRFLAVSAEELGMLGSKHYVQEAKRKGISILGALNADMIGYPSKADTTELVIASAWTPIPLLDSAVAFNRRYSVGLRIRDTTDDSFGSDHIPFALAGYPALLISEGTAWEIWGGANPFYHTGSDTHEKLHPGLIRRGAQIMLATIAELAQPMRRISSTASVAGTPKSFHLGQNYPNPFNLVTNIGFDIPEPTGQWSQVSSVTLSVYDVLGREVAILVDEAKAPGVYNVEFDASNLSSGVYFVRMSAIPTRDGNGFSAVRKIVLTK